MEMLIQDTGGSTVSNHKLDVNDARCALVELKGIAYGGSYEVDDTKGQYIAQDMVHQFRKIAMEKTPESKITITISHNSIIKPVVHVLNANVARFALDEIGYHDAFRPKRKKADENAGRFAIQDIIQTLRKYVQEAPQQTSATDSASTTSTSKKARPAKQQPISPIKQQSTMVRRQPKESGRSRFRDILGGAFLGFLASAVYNNSDRSDDEKTSDDTSDSDYDDSMNYENELYYNNIDNEELNNEDNLNEGNMDDYGDELNDSYMDDYGDEFYDDSDPENNEW